jgi:hypothetical protein
MERSICRATSLSPSRRAQNAGAVRPGRLRQARRTGGGRPLQRTSATMVAPGERRQRRAARSTLRPFCDCAVGAEAQREIAKSCATLALDVTLTRGGSTSCPRSRDEPNFPVSLLELPYRDPEPWLIFAETLPASL